MSSTVVVDSRAAAWMVMLLQGRIWCLTLCPGPLHDEEFRVKFQQLRETSPCLLTSLFLRALCACGAG